MVVFALIGGNTGSGGGPIAFQVGQLFICATGLAPLGTAETVEPLGALQTRCVLVSVVRGCADLGETV